MLITAFALLVFLTDNLLFVVRYIPYELGYYLTPIQREILAEIDRRGLEGVVISTDPDLEYLAATYTRLIPYRGHGRMIPDADQRVRWVQEFWEGRRDIATLNNPKYILLDRPVHDEHTVLAKGYRPLFQKGSWLLLER